MRSASLKLFLIVLHHYRTTARLGDLNLDPKIDDGATPLDVPIQRIILHKDYSSRNFTNDIALLVLKDSINFTGKFL